MSKARLLADLMRDNKISLSEVAGTRSASDYNVDETGYNDPEDGLDKQIEALQDENLLKLGV